jgi:hypothetical protein
VRITWEGGLAVIQMNTRRRASAAAHSASELAILRPSVLPADRARAPALALRRTSPSAHWAPTFLGGVATNVWLALSRNLLSLRSSSPGLPKEKIMFVVDFLPLSGTQFCVMADT